MRARAIAVTALAALAVAGCGDKPTKAEYIAQVDRICKREQAKRPALERAFARARDRVRKARGRRAKMTRLAAAYDEADRTQSRALDDLKDIERPDGEAGEEAERFIKANEQDVEVIRRLRDALEQGNVGAIQQIQLQANARRGETKRIAQDYGFEVCGSG